MAIDLTRPFQSLFSSKTKDRFYVKDFKNAERVRVDVNPPRQRFQGYVNFIFNRSLLGTINDSQEFRTQISSLVRVADLPSVSFKTDTKNQYNRKKIVHKGVEFPPVNIKVLDTVGNEWLTILMKYYAYLYMNPRNTFKDKNRDPVDWSMMTGNNPSDFMYSQDGFSTPGAFDSNSSGFNVQLFANFFERIDLIIYHGSKAVQYSLQNPVLTGFKSGQIDYASADFLEFDMTFDYENFTIYDKLNFQMGDSDLSRFENVSDLPLWEGNKPLALADSRELDLQFLGNVGRKPQYRAGQPTATPAFTASNPTYQQLSDTYDLNPAPSPVDFLKDPAQFLTDAAVDVLDRGIATAVHGGNVKDVVIQAAAANTIQAIQNSPILARIRGGS